MRLRFPFFSLVILLLAFTARADDNLLVNPGFEDGLAPWTENNWQHNEAAYVLDADRPHSGLHSFRMDFIKAVGGSNTSFLYPKLPVRSGQTLRISYWARGVSNGPALFMRVRKGGAPYDTYFQAESLLTEQWQQYVYTINLADRIDAANTQLLFYTIIPGSIWLDDVSVSELSPVEGGTAPTVNPIRNPSFEVGRDGWTATFRKREFKTLREESGGNYPSPDNAVLETPEDQDSPHGRRHLSFDIAPDSRAFLTSAYFPARYGHPMLLRFSLRSDAAREFSVGVGSGKNGNYTIQGRSKLTSTDGWKNYAVPVTLKASLGGVYFVEFELNEPGHYDIDAVSIAETEANDIAMYPASVAVEAAPDAPIAQLYAPGQQAGFVLRVADETPSVAKRYEATVFDFLGHERAREELMVATDDDGYGSAGFTVPTDRLGAFRIAVRELSAPASDLPVAEQLYSVLPPLPPTGERPDSFFGGHLDLTPYNLEIGRKAGFRWLRLYAPLCTLWMAVEREPGVWTFDVGPVERAHQQGFQFVGNLSTAPDFAADIDPAAQAREKSRWRRSFVPADLDRWKAYVTRTINAFHPAISTWEVWNEPDGDYMRFRPGLKRDEVYLSLLKAAREAVDANDKPVTLIGPAVSGINDRLGWEILEKGAGALLDAYSFHHYALAAGGDNPVASFLTPVLERFRSYQNRAGEPMPLWHTEGGAYINGAQSWLQTYRVPESSSVTPPQAAASMVRTALFFKASGVKRYFDFQVGASAAGRRVREDITDGFIDVTGIPGPGIASHAAMVALVEDTKPLGFETKTLGDRTVHVASFTGAAGRIDACWSPVAVPATELIGPDESVEIRDIMGNPVEPKDAVLGEFPLYLIRHGK